MKKVSSAKNNKPGNHKRTKIKKISSVHITPARLLGFSLLVFFLIVPVLFVMLFLRSDPAESVEPLDDSVLGISEEDHVSGQSDMAASPLVLPTDVPALEPVDQPLEQPEEEQTIEIIGVAYLTFDDGPSRAITPGILDILAGEDIKATFFTMPYSGAEDIFNRIIEEGHEIGNHSFSHDYPKLYNGSVSAFRDDVLRARWFIEENFGYTTTSFRFPGGSQDQTRAIRNPRIEAVREIGYRYFDWDIDSNDWRRGRTAEEVVEDVLSGTNGKEHVIILFHDTYERTLEALPDVIEGLKQQGYEFDILRNHPG